MICAVYRLYMLLVYTTFVILLFLYRLATIIAK